MLLNTGATHSFQLHPSRYFMGLLLLIHVGAMMCVLAVPLTWWADVLIAIVLLISLIYYIERYVRFGLKKSVRMLQMMENGHWQLQQTNKDILTAKLLGDSVLTRYLLILNLQSINDKKRYTVIIFKDALASAQFRQLRLLCLNQKGE